MGTLEKAQIKKQFLETGTNIRALLEGPLEIPMASSVDANTLALIGAATYAGDQFDMDPTAVENSTRKHLKKIPPTHIAAAGVSKRVFETRYRELLGTRLNDGAIAEGLRTAAERTSEEDAALVRDGFAELFAFSDKLGLARSQGRPGIRLHYDRRTIGGYEGENIFPLPQSVTTVVEYGPGIVARKKISDEAHHTPVTIFVERNPFVNHFLGSRAYLEGLTEPNTTPTVLTVGENVSTGSEKLLTMGSGIADIVIAARVVPAEFEDLQAGIHNARELLRPGGLYVAQERFMRVNPITGLPNEPLLQEAINVFGNPRSLRGFDFPMGNGTSVSAYNAVFER